MSTDDNPSIAELRTIVKTSREFGSGLITIRNAAPVLLEIAAAALELGPELVYLQGPLSERLREALAKVRP